MNSRNKVTEPKPLDAYVEIIRDRFHKKRPVTLDLPDGGGIHLDRPLPFVCVYRHHASAPVRAEEMVTSQAAFAVARSPADWKTVKNVARWLARDARDRFHGFMLVDVSLKDPANGHGTLRPQFSIRLPREQAKTFASTITILKQALGKVRLQHLDAKVTVSHPTPQAAKNTLSPLAGKSRARELLEVSLEVKPVFRNAETGGIFPLLFQDLRDQVAVALKETFFEFDRHHTSYGAPHFHALGPHAINKRVLQADAELEDCASSYEFLLQVTPTNPLTAWRAFQKSRYKDEPEFRYRPLTVDPELVKRRIYSLELEKIGDPTLALLLRRRRDEIDRQLTMLFDRGTRRFLHGSLQLFSGVDEDLMKLARAVLSKLPPEETANGVKRPLSARKIAQKAEREIAYYEAQYAGFSATVSISDSIPPGLMVSGRRLLIGTGTELASERLEPILHHEVGTHLLTYFNGSSQPIKQMRSGLAGYEELQEGLAIFSEFLCGSLPPARLRLLAARVRAVAALIEGATFQETFHLLNEECALPPHAAFLATMRVYRGGGFTKDAIYLRGLRDLLAYLKGGGAIETLLVGKIAFDHIPLIEELKERKVITEAPLFPRYLESQAAQERLASARQGLSVLQLAA